MAKRTDQPTQQDEYRQQRDTIYTYFYYLNKPVIATEVALQFKEIKKATVQKILDDLVGKEKIFFRLLGKSKIYCLSQDMTFSIDENIYNDKIDKTQNQEIEDKTLRFLKWNYEQKIEELNLLKEENRKLDKSIEGFDNQLSVEELKGEISQMKKIVKEYDSLKKPEFVSLEEFNDKKKTFLNLKKELLKRTGIFKNIVDGICEGCGLKKKDLFVELGID